jgi:hypothetical protein
MDGIVRPASSVSSAIKQLMLAVPDLRFRLLDAALQTLPHVGDTFKPLALRGVQQIFCIADQRSHVLREPLACLNACWCFFYLIHVDLRSGVISGTRALESWNA